MTQMISHPNDSFPSNRIKKSEDGKVSMAFLMGKTELKRKTNGVKVFSSVSIQREENN